MMAVECVFGELLQGPKSSREEATILGDWDNLPKQPESGLWVEAGKVSSNKKWHPKGVGLIDAFLLCFARTYGLQLWTLDKKLASIAEPQELFSLGE